MIQGIGVTNSFLIIDFKGLMKRTWLFRDHIYQILHSLKLFFLFLMMNEDTLYSRKERKIVQMYTPFFLLLRVKDVKN